MVSKVQNNVHKMCHILSAVFHSPKFLLAIFKPIPNPKLYCGNKRCRQDPKTSGYCWQSAAILFPPL